MKFRTSILQESLIVTLCAGAVLVLGILCHAGGYLHWESSAFLLNYTADRPLLEIIFDPARNDWGLYQCRELSYLFDCLDACVLFRLLKTGNIFFVSVSAILFSLFTLWFQQYAGRQLFPRLPGFFFTGWALAFALLPALTGSIFFRSSKFIAAAGITVLLFGTALRCCRRSSFWGGLPCLGTAALMTVFCDRQGLFLVTAFTGILSVMQFFRPLRALRQVVFLCAGAVALQVAANLWIVPGIIRLLNGYDPDFSYQGNFSIDFSLFPAGAEFLTANCGNVLTGLPSPGIAAAAGIFLLCVIIFLLRRRKYMPCWVFPGTLLSLGVCCGLMVLRHPALMDKDVLFSVYFLPSFAVLNFFCFAAAEALPGRIIQAAVLLPLLAVSLRLLPYLSPEKLFTEDKYQKIYQEGSDNLRRWIEDPEFRKKPHIMPVRLERVAEKISGKGNFPER